MFVTYILSKIRAYKLYRQTVNKLSKLSDRELTDRTRPPRTAEFRLRRGKVAAWRLTTTRSMRPCSP